MIPSVAAKIKASGLPWWGWLLIAAAFVIMGDHPLGITGRPVTGLLALADFAFIGLGIFLLVIGLMRFVKWAWNLA